MCRPSVVHVRLHLFEGPAGSGKTTRVFEALTDILQTRPLGENERVLALTKMHGSRRRMQSRLLAIPMLRGRFECITMDSFAWRIFRRWRSLARTKDKADAEDLDYEAVCKYTASLLAEVVVQRWVTRRFPVVVIDEMQDSKDGQLEIIQSLSQSATCLTAADDYQDLDARGQNMAVTWARQCGTVVLLTNNYRTAATGLLAAASALREGRAVPQDGKGFKILGALNYNVGASYLSHNLTWWGCSNDIAIITPVRGEKSTFVRRLVYRVEEKPISKPPVGPFRLPWEESQTDQIEQFIIGLNLPTSQSVELTASEMFSRLDESGTANALRAWLERQRHLVGDKSYTQQEIRKQVGQIHQRLRAHRRVRQRGVRVMTIHQAKNREFDSVIVLWPYQVTGSPERQRRLLYNAITRAKREALVIVQNPDRLRKVPFVPAPRVKVTG